MDTKEYERLVSLYLGSIYRVALNGCTCGSDAEDFEDDGHARGTYVVNGVFKRYGLKKLEDGSISCSIYSPPKALWPEDLR